MARFDGNLEAAGEAKLDIEELLSVLSNSAHLGREERQDAIACFLSASEGWREAKGALRGAFASVPRPSWLRNGKE